MGPATVKRHFLTLDALRGVAALAVMFYHVSDLRLTCGFLAVDLFFILSGFVIALAYEEKLAAGYGFGEFLVRRLIRLYPMILLGSVAGFLSVLVRYPDIALSAPRELIAAFVASLLVLPHPQGTAFGIETFPLNTVIWSLFFELAANFAWGLGLYRLRTAGLVALSLACLLAVGLLGPLGGSQAQNFWAGFPRVSFGFFAGVALYRFWRAGVVAPARLRLIPLSCLLGALFLIPVILEGFAAVPALLMLAAIVAMALRIEEGEDIPASLRFLGAISYPLYALHMPLLNLVKAAVPGFGETLGPVVIPQFAGACALMIGVAWLAARKIDEPVRAWLMDRSMRRLALRRASA